MKKVTEPTPKGVTLKAKAARSDKNHVLELRSITQFSSEKPPVILLAIAAIALFYLSAQGMTQLGILAILISAFSILAIYLPYKSKMPGRLVTGSAWLFIVMAAWTLFTWLVAQNPSDGRLCPEISCSQVALFQTVILFFNPLSLMLLSALAIGGIATMLMRLKK